VKVCPAIVSVAVRAAVLVLADALNATAPAPVPLAPDVTVSHDALLLAVHAQPFVAVIVTDPVPPADVSDWVVADKVYEHEVAACVTVNVTPATVSVPVRTDCVVFAAIANPTEPDPLPLAPLVIVSQDALLDAVHVQPAGLVTLTLPLPPPDAADCVVAESDVEQTTEY
jgi:hypothetical protein